jgi:hypothetical protein
MLESGGNGSEPKKPAPEDRVIALAKKWRQADKDVAAKKDQSAGIREYRLRNELRDAIDKLF